MTAIDLTPHQHAALAWVVQRVQAGASLVALRGLAGTGKTSLIPTLRVALEMPARPVSIGTPTHRAAMILRCKGIAEAHTLHQLALTPYFTPDYARAVAWLGGEAETPAGSEEDMGDSPDTIPPLVEARLEELGYPTTPEELYES
jgi:hypothetical protein